jgi:hypothetical protein
VPKEFNDGETSEGALKSDRLNFPERSRKNKIFKFFYQICTNSIFATVIILLIIANTVVLALDRHPIDATEFKTLEILNDVISWCFFAEMIIKFIGLGFREYARDKFNLFDCFIVVMSTIESVMAWA